MAAAGTTQRKTSRVDSPTKPRPGFLSRGDRLAGGKALRDHAALVASVKAGRINALVEEDL